MSATATNRAEFPGAGLAAGAPLGESVRRLATSHPGEPALFFREGWDWRWWTWARLAAAMEAEREGLGRLPDAGNSRLDAGDPAAVAALAARDFAVETGAGGIGGGDFAAGLPPAPARGGWRRAMSVPAREVVVDAQPGASPARLRWLRWAIGRGAAVVLAPTAASWVEVVLFARPTVLWGGAAEASAVLERARGRRRSVDRLRAFAWVDPGQPPDDVIRRFGDLGIAVLGPRAPAATGTGSADLG